jgi:uncharacterized damage-inducible protein DinB
MAIKEMLLPEFDQEMATTRKLLERVPEDKPEWGPHAKSMTLARLAGHVSELPMWATMTLTQDSIDLNPPGGPTFAPAVMTSRQELLKSFDGNVKAAREALAGAQDQDFMKPWSLLSGGKTLFTLPKMAVLRSFVLSHLIHHRAQLGVYLRINDIPLPQSYGPTADEGAM